MKAIFLFLSLLIAAQTIATEEQIKFDDANQKALYGELVKELRCPKCQNQNIADSNAVVAKDMRAKTKQLVEQGQDKEQVIDYMINRYGQFAHYQPPLNAATSLLWLLPILFISLAILMLVKRSRNPSQTGVAVDVNSSNDQGQEMNQALDKELDALLSKTKSASKSKSTSKTESVNKNKNTNKTEGDK